MAVIDPSPMDMDQPSSRPPKKSNAQKLALAREWAKQELLKELLEKEENDEASNTANLVMQKKKKKRAKPTSSSSLSQFPKKQSQREKLEKAREWAEKLRHESEQGTSSPQVTVRNNATAASPKKTKSLGSLVATPLEKSAPPKNKLTVKQSQREKLERARAWMEEKKNQEQKSRHVANCPERTSSAKREKLERAREWAVNQQESMEVDEYARDAKHPKPKMSQEIKTTKQSRHESSGPAALNSKQPKATTTTIKSAKKSQREKLELARKWAEQLSK